MDSKLRDAVFGLAVGDALGVPFEFQSRGSFTCSGMTSGGRHRQPKGTWSDDTSLTLATCYSLKEQGRIDLDHIMRCFRAWLWYGKFAINKNVFDVGGTCALTINMGHGLQREDKQGNGSLMRILPLAFLPDVTDQEIEDVSALTHDSTVCKSACVLYVRIAKDLLNGIPLEKSISDRASAEGPFVSLLQLKDKKESEISSSGHVLSTLEAALWCLKNTNSYRECVLKAVNLGDDTDTVAAVAGGLAGIMYGEKSIPREWIWQLRGKKIIKECLF